MNGLATNGLTEFTRSTRAWSHSAMAATSVDTMSSTSDPGRFAVNPGLVAPTAVVICRRRLAGDCGCRPAGVTTVGGSAIRQSAWWVTISLYSSANGAYIWGATEE